MKHIFTAISFFLLSGQLFSQSADPSKKIDSVLLVVKDIKSRMDRNSMLEKEVEDLKKQKRQDTLQINDLENQIGVLNNDLKKIKEKVTLAEALKIMAEKDLSDFKARQKKAFEQKIDLIIKGSIYIDSILLVNISDEAKQLNAANSGKLNEFIAIRDSLSNAQLVFFEPYDPKLKEAGIKKLKQLLSKAEKSFPGNNDLQDEISTSIYNLEDYCKNTIEFNNAIKKAYILRNNDTKFTGNDREITDFKRELFKVYFFVRHYDYLRMKLNEFKNEVSKRDDIHSLAQKPIVCN